MFEFPFNEDAKSYTIHISSDSPQEDSSDFFLLTSKTNLPAIRISNLPLGKKYNWHVETKLKSGKIEVSENHFFLIQSTVFADRKKYVIKQNYYKKNKILDGLIWCDEFHCAVNRKGEVVWFMNETTDDFNDNKQIRDFKFHNDGSLTFISKPNAYHIKKNLEVIWMAPKISTLFDKKMEEYHHDFEILSNGNYMVMGNEMIELENKKSDGTIQSETVDFTSIIEFNNKGNVVWCWTMKEHIPKELFINSNIKTANGIVKPHANSFCVDEANDFIYISFKGVSRIMKIDKKTKKIVATYGQPLQKNDETFSTDLFHFQHDVQLLNNNDLFIFNNNEIEKGNVSSIEIIKQPKHNKDKLELKWEFKLNFDSINNGRSQKMGGMKLLPNNNILINEGSLNRIVEINRNKKVLWDLIIEKFDTLEKKTLPFPLYRVDFSSSLYPYYFYAEKISPNCIYLLNTGDNKDIYTIKIINTNNKQLEFQKQIKLSAKGSKKINFPLKNNLSYRIEIISLKSGIVKTILF